MSLPTRQQRILDRIEHLLRDSDPRLTSLFAIFSRLTREEEMPRVEELKARFTRLGGWLSRRATPVRRHIPRPSARLRAILFFPAALAAMTCALLIGAGLPGANAAQRCAPTGKAATTEFVVKARQCRLPLIRTPILGH